MSNRPGGPTVCHNSSAAHGGGTYVQRNNQLQAQQAQAAVQVLHLHPPPSQEQRLPQGVVVYQAYSGVLPPGTIVLQTPAAQPQSSSSNTQFAYLKRFASAIVYFCANSTGPDYLYRLFTCHSVPTLPPNFMADFVQPMRLRLDEAHRNTWTFEVREKEVELTKKPSVYLLELQALLMIWVNASRRFREGELLEEEDENDSTAVISPSPPPPVRPTAAAGGGSVPSTLRKLMLRSQGEAVFTPLRLWLGVEAPEVSMQLREPNANDHDLRDIRTSLPTDPSRLSVIEWCFTPHTRRPPQQRKIPTLTVHLHRLVDRAVDNSILITKYGKIRLPLMAPSPSVATQQPSASGGQPSPKDVYAAVAKSQLVFLPGWGYIAPRGAEPALFLDHITRKAYERVPDIRQILEGSVPLPNQGGDFSPKAAGEGRLPPSSQWNIDDDTDTTSSSSSGSDSSGSNSSGNSSHGESRSTTTISSSSRGSSRSSSDETTDRRTGIELDVPISSF